VIIVDDRLSLEALGGRIGVAGEVATTWGFHYRLLRALHDETRLGALSRHVSPRLRGIVADPPPDRLVVLDPRLVTRLAAELTVLHGLNLLAAELFASALHHRASVLLSAPNVGRTWADVAATEGIALEIA